MVDNISFLFSWLCVFLSITDMQNVQLQTIPNPCPDIAAHSTIVDMCTIGYATEDYSKGGTTVDSVSLRVIKQQDGCTCKVTLLNQKDTYTLYMRKYDSMTSAAPEHVACGLAVDIDYDIPNNLNETNAPVECIKGTAVRSISLSKNKVLHFQSRIIGGNFSRGYCMQIYRPKIDGDTTSVQIHCTDLHMQTTQHLIDTTIYDKTVEDTDSTLYIAIGVGSAVVVIALIVVVSIIIIRRKINKNKDGTEVQPEADCTDYDSDGLKYNTLYNASEQQVIMEGDYHTVDLERKHNKNEKHNLGSDYSAVDGNYSSVDIVNMPAKDGSKTDNRIKSSSTTTPISETQTTEEDISNNLKHVIAGINVEYAVVDKSGRTEQNIKHITAPNNSNVEYAVIDKK